MKKGFTLVEMIGIIVILAAIILVTVPATINTLNKSNQKRFEAFKNNLKMVTENYIVDHKQTSLSSLEITLQVLLDEHYIQEIPQIPTDDPFAESTGSTDLTQAYVKVTKDSSTKLYSYELCQTTSNCERLD